MMEQRKSGNGVKVAKRVARELAKKIKCYNNSKTQIRNQFCTEVNVKKAGLRYKKDFFPILLEEYEKLQEKRRKKAATKARNTLKKEMGAKNFAEMEVLQKKEKEIADYLSKTFPYRQSQNRWAEPHNTIDFHFRKDGVKGHCRTSRCSSSNGKWWGEETHHYFQSPKNYIVKIIGGLVTIYDQKFESKLIKPCTWWEQSRGFEIKQKKGFLIKNYHSEAKTADAALTAFKALKTKEKNRVKRLENKTLTPEWCHKKFGWCLAGIRNFMNVNGIETNSITVKELRNIIVKNREINCKNYVGYLRKLGIFLNCK
jgi:hypothetical protein